MTSAVKICLTCGKRMAPAAHFCPRCGSAFLRMSPVPVVASIEPAGRLGAAGSVLIRRPHHWAWIAGRLLRRGWEFVLSIW